jgi:TetR/AcrR family transcriptional regulator, cholesterol catabolism regulator
MTESKTIVNRRAHILESAAHLFRTQGYASVTMRELAESVGIESSSLYSHFEKKEDILWEIAIQCANDFNDTVQPIAQSDLLTKKKLREMMVAHVNVTLSNRESASVFTQEWRHFTEPRLTEYAELRNQYEDMFRAVIAQGIRENQFRQLDEKFSTLTLLSALNWTYLWYRPEGEMSPVEIGENLADLLLNGLERTI